MILLGKICGLLTFWKRGSLIIYFNMKTGTKPSKNKIIMLMLLFRENCYKFTAMSGNDTGYWPMKREFNLNHYEIFKYVCKWLEPFNKLIWKLIFEIIWNSDCQNFYSYIFSVRGRLGIIVHYSPLLFQKFCCMVSNSKEIVFTFLKLQHLKAVWKSTYTSGPICMLR